MTEQNNLKAVILSRIVQIAAAEKITRKELGIVSRELLLYVPESRDIEVVNRLIGVLTPMNKKTAILFFKEFLPWEQETDNDDNHVRFGKMYKKPRSVTKKIAAIVEFLKEEGNNIWTWAHDNVKVEQKPKDFAGQIKRAIAKALDGDANTEALTHAEILSAVLATDISVDDLLIAVENATSPYENGEGEAAPEVQEELKEVA